MFVLLVVVILSIPSGLTYLLYRHLRKKGDTQKKIGLTIFVLTTATMLFIGLDSAMSGFGFGPEYETEIINQKIGGKLICESVYNADHHSWQYNVDYKYINQKGDTLDFSGGVYYGREWNNDEQIQKYKNWLILKTGAWHGSDRLIIKNIQTDTTKIYDIDNNFIEKDSLWRAQNIESLSNFCCAETFIENIQENRISLTYKFRTDEKMTLKYGNRKVTYEIENETGKIVMTDIK